MRRADGGRDGLGSKRTGRLNGSGVKPQTRTDMHAATHKGMGNAKMWKVTGGRGSVKGREGGKLSARVLTSSRANTNSIGQITPKKWTQKFFCSAPFDPGLLRDWQQFASYDLTRATFCGFSIWLKLLWPCYDNFVSKLRAMLWYTSILLYCIVRNICVCSSTRTNSRMRLDEMKDRQY